MKYKIHSEYPLYKIYSNGDIYRLSTGVKLKGYIKKNRGKPVCVTVTLKNKDGIYKYVRVHRLVLELFRGSCPEGFEACHNNGNCLDNDISNLRWDTHKNNIKDMMEHGTKVNPPIHYGESHHKTTLKEQDIIDIRSYKIKRGIYANLAKKYKVSHVTIKRIMNFETWKMIKQ